MIVVISGSLHPMSRSRVLARHTVETLASMQVETDFIDLRDIPMEFCNGAGGGKSDEIAALAERIAAADGILVSVPIYVYDVNAAVKNLVELTGRSWTDKVVGFLCAAGGSASYMSVMAFANSLMLDFRCLIVPRFVYATGDDFADDRTESMSIATDDLRQRLDELARATVHLCRP